MDDIELVPYLFFKGNARKAFEFYKDVFGGELQMQTMAEVPKEAQMPGVNPADVMHARLSGGGVVLMGSDSKSASDHSAKVELSLSGSDGTKLKKIFDTLADGGKVNMPLSKQFWGAEFGMLRDKFGVDWMVNINQG